MKPPLPYPFVSLLRRKMIMHVEKEKMGEKEKLFALFVPKFDKVCADAKAPAGLTEVLGKAARGKSSTAGTRRGKRKGREGDPRAQEGVREKVTLPRPCREHGHPQWSFLQLSPRSSEIPERFGLE